MNTYSVALSSLGVVVVEAESVVETEKSLIFYRYGLLCAQYPRTLVESWEAVESSSPRFPVGESEDSQTADLA